MTSDESRLLVEASRILSKWREILDIQEEHIYVEITDAAPIGGKNPRIEYKPEVHKLLVDPRIDIKNLDKFIGHELIYRLLIQHFKEVWLERWENELISNNCGGWLLGRFSVLQKMDQEGENTEAVDAVNLIRGRTEREIKEIMYTIALRIYNLYQNQN